MRLRTRQQYKRMAYKGAKFVGRFILVDVLLVTKGPSRLGITVTKKYGSSPQRNRFKRLVREAFRLSCSSCTPPIDLVVRPRSYALEASFIDIEKELSALIKKAIASLEKRSSGIN